MSATRFLELSDGIPDYQGPDLEKIQAQMLDADAAIDLTVERMLERVTLHSCMFTRWQLLLEYL
jgi:hypothetical protein